MRSIRLPNDPGPAGWSRLLPDPAPARVLDERLRADWLVIGAGFAGLTAAYRLRQLRSEDRIVILDATRVGDGPAGRNSGFMIDLPHDLTSDDYGGALELDRAQIADNRRAIGFAAKMVQELGLPQEAFDPVGKVNGAATRKGHSHNLHYTQHLDQLGEPYEILDAAAMEALTGTPYYQSGVYTPGTVMLQPAQYVRGIAAGIGSNRVTLFENSPVVDLALDKDWIAKTPKGQITAPRVILATNGHLESFGYLKNRLIHTHTYASMTRPLSAQDVSTLGGAPNWNLTPADPLGTTVRRISGHSGDRIVIRNRFTYDDALAPNSNWLDRIKRDHDQSFNARFPMLKGVEMEFRWGGRLCLSQNGVQVVRELDKGLYAACVQNGLGTAKGTLAGILAAELACGVTSAALKRAQTDALPTRLPPKYITRLGATARLRFGEWRAGLEK